jgi:ABC-type Fe3+/spermidine/putrescine transport system ATPase subunit
MSNSSSTLTLSSENAGLTVTDFKVHVNDLTIRLDQFHAAPGTWTKISARSGFGKTTLLRGLAGLIESSGQVKLDGIRIDRLSVPKREIGFVFQDHHLFSHMTVSENVEYGLKIRNGSNLESGTLVREALKWVGLEEKFNAPVMNCSGGERQRIAILRALIWGPKLLLLDEPLSGLDAESRTKTITFIRRVVDQVGCPAIWISHSTEEDDSIEFQQQLIVKEHHHDHIFEAHQFDHR